LKEKWNPLYYLVVREESLTPQAILGVGPARNTREGEKKNLRVLFSGEGRRKGKAGPLYGGKKMRSRLDNDPKPRPFWQRGARRHGGEETFAFTLAVGIF